METWSNFASRNMFRLLRTSLYLLELDLNEMPCYTNETQFGHLQFTDQFNLLIKNRTTIHCVSYGLPCTS